MRVMIKSIFIVYILLFSGVYAGSHPLGLNENFSYGILTDRYESPHIKWAKPYIGGPIKTLVMAPEWSQRETVELAQRLSIDFTPWMTSAFNQIAIPAEWFWYPTPASLMDELLSRYISEKFDVIVIGKLNWSMLPEKYRFELLRKVSEGTGLVYVGPPKGNSEIDLVYSRRASPEGFRFITKGIPFSSLPQLKNLPVEKIVYAGFFGKGRVVSLDYGQNVPETKGQDGNYRAATGYPALTPQWDTPEYEEVKKGYVPPDECAEAEFVPYEYYQALVARAVIWASGKVSEPSIQDVSLPSEVGYPADGNKAIVKIDSIPSGGILKSAVRSRYEYERVYEIPSQSAKEINYITLPSIPSGEYILDVWLSSDGKVFDWASKGFTVKSDIEIVKILLDGRNYNPGDKVTGEVILNRKLNSDEVITGELWDNYGRKIEDKKLSGEGDRYKFSFTLGDPLTIMHSIKINVIKKGKEICEKRFNFPVRAKRKGFDDFNEIVWASGTNQFLTHLMLRKLFQEDQADAIDLGWRGATQARNVALANLTIVPYTAGFGHFGSKVVPVTGQMNGCMTAPATFKAIDDWGRLQGEIFGPYGTLVWTHGDESFYALNPDSCWSDTCLSAFREYLKTRYPDITSLNKEWKTDYKNWDEVMPLTFEEALNTGNYAPWIEHRLAQQYVFARLYNYTGKALSVNDPGARIGFDGNLGFNLPNGGINWWVLKDYINILHSYIDNSQEMEIFRSFAGPDHIAGMWYGTYGPSWQIGPNTVEYHHFFPWYSLFHGLNSTWFWTMGSPGPYSGYASDFTNMPFMQASRDALAEIRSGIGKLLLSGRLEDDGIAIHYSEASHIADSIFSGKKTDELGAGITIDVKSPSTTVWKNTLADFNKALEHSGFQYRYVSYEEVEKNILTERGYKVFIMPHSYAVSEKEAEAIRRFVYNGGLLIADIVPGILNGHGTKMEKSILADLFPSTEPGIVNKIGKGKTVLLGNKLKDYGYLAFNNMAGWKKLDGRHRILAELIEKEAGIKSRVVITHRGKGDMPPTEIFRRKIGDAEYVGLLREYFLYDNNPYPVSIKFPGKSHIYNMRTGKYLGFTDSIETEISYEAQLYAALPYRVTSIKIVGPESAERGKKSEFVISVDTTGTVPSLHLFRVEVAGPDGKKLPYYASNIKAEKGTGRYTINWALNEKQGRYTIYVKDIATGTGWQKTVVLR